MTEQLAHRARTRRSRRGATYLFLLAAACAGSGCETEEEGTGAPTMPGEPTADAGIAMNDSGQPSQGTLDASSGPSDAGKPTFEADADFGQGSGGDSFLRADTLVLATPNIFAKPFGIELRATDQAQTTINDTLVSDGDADGNVDLSLLIRFLKTAQPRAQKGDVTVGGGFCKHPQDSAVPCGSDPGFPFQTPPLQYDVKAPCVLDGTMEQVADSCFATSRGALTLTLPLLGRVPLEDAQVIGRFADTGITEGRVRGFLSMQVAGSVRLPDPVPPLLAQLGIKPGTPLTDFLSNSELSAGPGGAMGWWFLLRFSAKPASFVATNTP